MFSVIIANQPHALWDVDEQIRTTFEFPFDGNNRDVLGHFRPEGWRFTGTFTLATLHHDSYR